MTGELAVVGACPGLARGDQVTLGKNLIDPVLEIGEPFEKGCDCLTLTRPPPLLAVVGEVLGE